MRHDILTVATVRDERRRRRKLKSAGAETDDGTTTAASFLAAGGAWPRPDSAASSCPSQTSGLVDLTEAIDEISLKTTATLAQADGALRWSSLPAKFSA